MEKIVITQGDITKLNDASKYKIKYVENCLNKRPRKKLALKTPNKVFFNTNESLTVALGT